MLWLTLLFHGCDLSKQADTGTDSGDDVAPQYLPVADVDWNENQLILGIEHGSGYDFRFGIVENWEDCLVDTEFGCWTGENCDPALGYVSPNGQTSLGPYCHPAGNSGLGLAYSSSLVSVINQETGNNVVEGQKTAFPSPTEEESWEFRVTYYLQDLISGDCWAWGTDPEFFDDRNCKYPVPVSAVGDESGTKWILE